MQKKSKEYLIFWNDGKDSIICTGLDIALLKVKELFIHNKNDIVIKQLDNENKRIVEEFGEKLFEIIGYDKMR